METWYGVRLKWTRTRPAYELHLKCAPPHKHSFQPVCLSLSAFCVCILFLQLHFKKYDNGREKKWAKPFTILWNMHFESKYWTDVINSILFLFISTNRHTHTVCGQKICNRYALHLERACTWFCSSARALARVRACAYNIVTIAFLSIFFSFSAS